MGDCRSLSLLPDVFPLKGEGCRTVNALINQVGFRWQGAGSGQGGQGGLPSVLGSTGLTSGGEESQECQGGSSRSQSGTFPYRAVCYCISNMHTLLLCSEVMSEKAIQAPTSSVTQCYRRMEGGTRKEKRMREQMCSWTLLYLHLAESIFPEKLSQKEKHLNYWYI